MGKSESILIPSDTQFTVAHGTNNLVTYYHKMFNRRVRKIDLKRIDFSQGKVPEIPLDQLRAQKGVL